MGWSVTPVVKRGRVYDLFEVQPNHSRVWRGSVDGLEAAVCELKRMAQTTANECLAVYWPTRQVVAIENALRGRGHARTGIRLSGPPFRPE